MSDACTIAAEFGSIAGAEPICVFQNDVAAYNRPASGGGGGGVGPGVGVAVEVGVGVGVGVGEEVGFGVGGEQTRSDSF